MIKSVKELYYFSKINIFSINNTHYTFRTTTFFIVCKKIHKYCGLNISVKSKKGWFDFIARKSFIVTMFAKRTNISESYPAIFQNSFLNGLNQNLMYKYSYILINMKSLLSLFIIGTLNHNIFPSVLVLNPIKIWLKQLFWYWSSILER